MYGKIINISGNIVRVQTSYGFLELEKIEFNQEYLQKLKMNPIDLISPKNDDELIENNENEETTAEGLDEEVQIQLPDFTLQSIKGEEINLYSYAGKKIILGFMSTGSKSGKKLLNLLTDFAKSHPDYVILVLAFDRSENSLLDNLAEYDITFKVMYVEKSLKRDIKEKYELKSLPRTFIIGTDGTTVASNLTYKKTEKELSF